MQLLAISSRLILITCSVLLAALFLISTQITRSDRPIIIAAILFGLAGTFLFIRRSPQRVTAIQGALFGASIGAAGWLLTTLVQVSILLFMGRTNVALAFNSWLIASGSLILLALLSGLGGLSVTLLLNRETFESKRSKRGEPS